jgi:hypothetical protein
MKRSLLISSGLVTATIFAASAAVAQAQEPYAELAKLEAALGSWTVEADMKPSVFGPGGRVTGIERYEWMTGGFFLRMERESEGPSGAFHHSFIFGYDPIARNHTAQWYDHTSGGSGSATIEIVDHTWYWFAAGFTGQGSPFQERCTYTFAADGNSYTVVCEVSPDGEAWSPSAEAIYTRLE